MKHVLLLSALFLTVRSYGADFVVHNGETVTATQTLTNPGDVGLIEENGRIETGGTGVDMTNNNQQVLNKGTISTQGNTARGIFNSAGANAVITNSGIIFTQGANAIGIFNNAGANAVITNSGTISTQGANGIGIGNGGANAAITNSGAISTQGSIADGIRNLGVNSLITNSGTISTQNVDAHGIFNSGGANVRIINSGTIRSAQANALNLIGINPTVTLLRGSNLQGPVNATDLLNLNVQTGLNLALTLTPASPGFNALGIDAPFVVVGNNIAVIDPTGLALQADVVADLSDTILGGIYRHRTGFPCCNNTCECGLWIEGLGSYRERNAQDSIVGYHNYQGGFLVGYDKPLWCGDVGVFGGTTFGKAVVNQNTQKADLSNYFAGLSYERIFCKRSFLGTSLIMGYSKLDSERDVMYNLAPNGIQTAESDPSGFFISPDITYAQQFPVWCYSPILSGSIRYAGLFLGNYHEHGSNANLSVEHRNIHLLTLRSEAGLPFGKSNYDFCWTLEPYIGVEGRFQVAGKRVDAELLGVSFSFDPGGPRNLAALLVGFRGKQDIGCFNLFLNVEAGFDNHRSSRVLGEGGVSFSF